MPKTYWMARALTADPKTSEGIIRMLSCGNENKALGAARQVFSDDEAVIITEDLAAMSQDQALFRAEELGIKSKIVEFTHCTPRETYIVVTDDMFERFHNTQYYAFWDFGKSSKTPNSYKAFQYYDCKKTDQFECNIEGNRAIVDPANNKFNVRVKKVVIIDEQVNEYAIDDTQKHVMFIYNRNGNYKTIVVDESIADSLFVRLSLKLDTPGFKLIGDYGSPSTVRALVYQVEW